MTLTETDISTLNRLWEGVARNRKRAAQLSLAGMPRQANEARRASLEAQRNIRKICRSYETTRP